MVPVRRKCLLAVMVPRQVFSDVMDGFMVMTRRGIGLAYCTTGQREHDFAAGWTDFGSGSADIPMTNAGYQGLRNCKPGRRSCSLRSWKHGNWTDWTHRTYAIGYIDAGHNHQRGFPEVSLQHPAGTWLTFGMAIELHARAQAVDAAADWSAFEPCNQDGTDAWPIVLVSCIYYRHVLLVS